MAANAQVGLLDRAFVPGRSHSSATNGVEITGAPNGQMVNASLERDEGGQSRLASAAQLLVVAPSPVVALNRAVAVAETAGPAAALEIVDRLSLTTICSTRSALIC